MLFTQTHIKGVCIVEPEKLQDDRGFFSRSWCEQEFAEEGLDAHLMQCSISFNHKKGTLRGMHFQLPPFAETKLVRCTQGSIYDVALDLRQDSETFLQWVGVELTADNHRALYIPKGFAHGFQTLADNTEVFYQISEVYAPEYARGLRWDDPTFKIAWQEPVSIISERDRNYENYSPAKFQLHV